MLLHCSDIIRSPFYFFQSKWLGGFTDKNGQPVTTFDTLKRVLGPDFDLIEEKNMPFFIRETARKNHWIVAHATIWIRKE